MIIETASVFIMRMILRAIWKLVFALNFGLGLIILYPAFRFLLSRKSWFPAAFRLKRFWARWILFIPGILVRIKNYNTTKLPQPCVICANHTSYLDIVLSYVALTDYFIFMGKQELANAPLFNIFFTEMNILVDRSSRMGSHRAFLRAGEDLEKGKNIFLFPEGTISKNAPDMRSFKNGAFKLAIEKQVPVLPVVFCNNWKILQTGSFFKANGRPGISRVVIHEPVETKGMTDEDLVTLREKVFGIIDKTLKEQNEQDR